MKKIFFALICAGLLTSCASKEESSPTTEPVTSAATQATTKPSTETLTKSDKEQEKETFTSAEEVISMSDSQLCEIAKKSLSTSYHDDIDLFDIPFIETTECHEWAMCVVPTTDYANDLDGFINAHLASYTDGHENIQGDVSYVVALAEYSDVESVFCGENNDYSEYSLCFTLTTKWQDDEGEHSNVSREARRFVYLKNILLDDDKYIYTGEMTAEAVREFMPLFRHIITPSHEIVAYSAVTDAGAFIRFSYFEVGYCGGDYGLNDTAFLSRRVYEIDKSSGVIKPVTEYENLREYEIPDTALKYE